MAIQEVWDEEEQCWVYKDSDVKENVKLIGSDKPKKKYSNYAIEHTLFPYRVLEEMSRDKDTKKD